MGVLDERGDPTVAVGWALIDQSTYLGSEFQFAKTGLGSTPLTQATEPLNNVRTGDTKRVGNGFHREPSRGCKLDSKVTFFERLASRASLRICSHSAWAAGEDNYLNRLGLSRCISRRFLSSSTPASVKALMALSPIP